MISLNNFASQIGDDKLTFKKSGSGANILHSDLIKIHNNSRDTSIFIEEKNLF